MDQKLAHLFLCLVVVGVCRFFLGQQPCKFFVQALDRGELFKSEIIKGFLRRLVKYDVALMLRKILFGVSTPFTYRRFVGDFLSIFWWDFQAAQAA